MENNIMAASFETGYKDVLNSILQQGRKRETRGYQTLELCPFTYYTSHPLSNLLTNKVRKINHAFAVAEFLWILSGRNDAEMVRFYNGNIANFSDNGVTFDGAYGPMIRQQLDYVIATLKNEHTSRQAVMTIWKPNPPRSRDIPCTVMLHFICDSMERLSLNVYMRSNDAWLGLPYDFFNFTMILNYVAMRVGMPIGYYHHVCGSEHLYSQHFELANQTINETTYVRDIHESYEFQTDELMQTLELERQIRMGNPEVNLTVSSPWVWMVTELAGFARRKAEKNG